MLSSRARTAFSIGSVCLFLLLLLLPQMSPGPVNAAWDPTITNATPKDPGTPFEEPEDIDLGDGGGGCAPGTIGAPPPVVATSKSASETVKIVWRQLVLPRLFLILWHLQ